MKTDVSAVVSPKMALSSVSSREERMQAGLEESSLKMAALTWVWSVFEVVGAEEMVVVGSGVRTGAGPVSRKSCV